MEGKYNYDQGNHQGIQWQEDHGTSVLAQIWGDLGTALADPGPSQHGKFLGDELLTTPFRMNSQGPAQHGRVGSGASGVPTPSIVSCPY